MANSQVEHYNRMVQPLQNALDVGAAAVINFLPWFTEFTASLTPNQNDDTNTKTSPPVVRRVDHHESLYGLVDMGR